MPLRVYLDISDPSERRRVQRDAATAGWLEVHRVSDADFVIRDAPAAEALATTESRASSDTPGSFAIRSSREPRSSMASRARTPQSGDGAEASSFGPAQEALTARELQVLMLLAEGVGNREIADRLGVSEHTVKFHLSAIFGKLGASTRTDAVRRALRAGLIDL